MVQAFLQLLFSSVQVVDVGCMVLGVVQLHDLGRYHRLQGVVGVGQRREGVLISHSTPQLPARGEQTSANA